MTVSQRREVTLKLNLITEDDLATPEAERYGRALIRASEYNMLQQLVDEVEKCEGPR